MIKGLYFKLNMGNPRDEFIYRFFTMQADTEGIDKIQLLDKLIGQYLKTHKNDVYGGTVK